MFPSDFLRRYLDGLLGLSGIHLTFSELSGRSFGLWNRANFYSKYSNFWVLNGLFGPLGIVVLVSI